MSDILWFFLYERLQIYQKLMILEIDLVLYISEILKIFLGLEIYIELSIVLLFIRKPMYEKILKIWYLWMWLCQLWFLIYVQDIMLANL